MEKLLYADPFTENGIFGKQLRIVVIFGGPHSRRDVRVPYNKKISNLLVLTQRIGWGRSKAVNGACRIVFEADIRVDGVSTRLTR